MMRITKKDITEILPYIVAIVLCIYWMFNGEKVSNDPYLLGLFRGIIWTPLFYNFIKKLA